MVADAPAGTPRRNPVLPPRERILAAVRELFDAHGIRAVSVDAIAEAAQSNKMTLYRHFESKDELVAEYLRGLAAQAEAQWDALDRNFPGDPERQLHAWFDFCCEEMASGAKRGCPFANAAVELPERDHPARAVIESVKTRHRAKLAELCRGARFAEPERLADEIVLLLEGARVDIQSVGPCGPGSRIIQMIRALISSHPKSTTGAGNGRPRDL